MLSTAGISTSNSFPWTLNNPKFENDGVINLVMFHGDSLAAGVGYVDKVTESGLLEDAATANRYDNTSEWEPLEPGVNSAHLTGSLGRFGPETPFAAYYYQQFGRPLYLTKFAAGGYTVEETSNASFHPDAVLGTPLYGTMLGIIQGAINLLGAAPYRLHLVISFGGNDAVTGPTAIANFQDNLNTLISRLEIDASIAFDQVLLLKLSDKIISTQANAATIRAASDAWEAEESRRFTVDGRHASFAHDGAHYDAFGYELICKEMFTKLFFI